MYESCAFETRRRCAFGSARGRQSQRHNSGVGGLTVFRAIEQRLPNESLIYLGDTARIPYGVRSAATIERYSMECATFVQSRGVKAIVIACNTASALAANYLRSQFELPITGVIRPGS